MPRLPSKQRLFDDVNIDELSSIERIYAHLINPKEVSITTRDASYLVKLEEAYGIIQANPVRYTQVKLIAEVCDVSQRQARNIITDSEHLFGNLYEETQKIDKKFLVLRWLRLAEKAEAEGDYDSAGKMYERIAKVEGLFDKEQGIRQEDLSLPDILITSDSGALTLAENDNIEEADIIDGEK